MRKEARSVKLFQEDVPFYRGNFHTHTTQSDGCKTPQEAMSAYREAGYDFLALTDHRKVTGVEQAPEGLVAIPGIELDYVLSNQWVHLLGLGVSPEVAAADACKIEHDLSDETFEKIKAHALGANSPQSR